MSQERENTKYNTIGFSSERTDLLLYVDPKIEKDSK